MIYMLFNLYKFWLILVFIIMVIHILFTDVDIDELSVTPWHFYEVTNLNFFGCILLSLLVFLIDPFIAIIQFIYWIVHVGRKK